MAAFPFEFRVPIMCLIMFLPVVTPRPLTHPCGSWQSRINQAKLAKSCDRQNFVPYERVNLNRKFCNIIDMPFIMHFPLISIINPDVTKEVELGKTGLGSLMTL